MVDGAIIGGPAPTSAAAVVSPTGSVAKPGAMSGTATWKTADGKAQLIIVDWQGGRFLNGPGQASSGKGVLTWRGKRYEHDQH